MTLFQRLKGWLRPAHTTRPRHSLKELERYYETQVEAFAAKLHVINAKTAASGYGGGTSSSIPLYVLAGLI